MEIWSDDQTRDPEENCFDLCVLWLTKNETAKIPRRYRTLLGLSPEQKTHSSATTES